MLKGSEIVPIAWTTLKSARMKAYYPPFKPEISDVPGKGFPEMSNLCRRSRRVEQPDTPVTD